MISQDVLSVFAKNLLASNLGQQSGNYLDRLSAAVLPALGAERGAGRPAHAVPPQRYQNRAWYRSCLAGEDATHQLWISRATPVCRGGHPWVGAGASRREISFTLVLGDRVPNDNDAPRP